MTVIELTPSARETVVISNTPSFLMHRLRADAAVQQAVDTHSSDELLQYIQALSDRGPTSPEELTGFYIAIIALCLKADAKKWRALKALSLDKIQWAWEIVSMLDSDRIAAYTADDEPTTIIQPAPTEELPSSAWEEQGQDTSFEEITV